MFETDATNLVPGDTNAQGDVYVRNWARKTTRRASLSSSGGQSTDYAGYSGISPDGRFVVFSAPDGGLVPHDMNGAEDVFVRDLLRRKTKRISRSSQTSGSANGWISLGGHFVAFDSEASDHVGNDTNGFKDVFDPRPAGLAMTVRRLGGATIALVVALALAPAASALTYKVTTRSDHAPGACTGGDCTLREAVLAANATLTVADTIVLPSTKPYRLTIAGTDEDGAMTGDLDIANFGLRIVHPGKGKATIGGNGLDRVFDVFLGAPATFEKLIIQGGHAVGMFGYGGGIRAGEKITVRASTVRGNRADGCGGGLHMQNGARLVMRNSKVTGNQANGDAGGISASCEGKLRRRVDRELDGRVQPRRRGRRRRRPRRRDLPPDQQRRAVHDPALDVLREPLQQRGRWDLHGFRPAAARGQHGQRQHRQARRRGRLGGRNRAAAGPELHRRGQPVGLERRRHLRRRIERRAPERGEPSSATAGTPTACSARPAADSSPISRPKTSSS